MEKLDYPNSQMTEGIYLLLTKDSVTRADAFKLAGILNYPAIIEIIRNKHHVAISTDYIEVKNKFGRGVSYGRYKCLDVKKLTDLYYSLLNKKPLEAPKKTIQPLTRNFQRDLFNG